MNTVRIKNLRSLTDTNDISIKPLTLLIGKNGSGKSTFARLFPLLRQSIEVNTKGPILWYGKHVDYGSFKESVNNTNNNSPISIKFSFNFKSKELNSDYLPRYFYGMTKTEIQDDLNVQIELDVLCDELDNLTYISSIKLNINDDDVCIDISKSGDVIKFISNNTDIIDLCGDYAVWQKSELLPMIKSKKIIKDESKPSPYFMRTFRNGVDVNILNAIKKHFTKFFHGSTKDETISAIVNGLPYTGIDNFYQHLCKVRGGSYYSKYVTTLTKDNYQVNLLRNLIIANVTEQLIVKLNEMLVEIFTKVYYIEPIRATAERYYREQDLSVDEVDSKGHNLPMFLKSLNDSERERFKNWTIENLGVEINAKSEAGHIAITITEQDSDNEYNLSDTGFGFSQILPIAAQLWALAERPKIKQGNVPIVLAIEQPELHLHPAHQAKIADMLIASIKAANAAGVDVRIIVETHSESIINRLGELSEMYNFNNNINLVVFEKSRCGDTSTYEAHFDENGSLINWPFGFFIP